MTLQNFLLIVENASLSYEEKLRQIKKEFVLYRSAGSDGRGKVLFTGYYEPLLTCRQSRGRFFQISALPAAGRHY